MRRLLLPLSGIAIIAVAINHASHNGISRLFEVMGSPIRLTRRKALSGTR
ncbi:MAG: hypothetical protein M5R40_29775 [Anaerolineae bacterium]|nr:hypothetical protein [Anaerolineae bacterium]